jgi:O-antigen/teichoic acid export membrane protein
MAEQTTSSTNAHPVVSSRRFTFNIVCTLGTRLLMIFNSVIAGVIVAHTLGVTGVGELAVINVSVATLVQLAAFGLPSANTFFISQDTRQFRSVALNSVIFALLFGSLVAIALCVAAQVRPDWFGNVATSLIRIAAVSIPFQLITLIGLNILLAIGKVRDFNLLDLAGQSFVLINSVIALILLHRGLRELVTFNTIASVGIGLVVLGLILVSGRKLVHEGFSWRTDLPLFREMMRYGFKFHISIVAGALIFRADLLVVNHFRGADEAGVYSVASQMGMMLMLLPSVIATLLFPRVSSEQDQRGETTCMVTRHTSFVMFILSLCAVPFSFLLPVVYGAGFAESSWQLLILLPGVYLVGLQSVLVQHFNALGLPRLVPLFWIITLVVNVALVFTLVPWLGARGAAIGSTVSYALIFVLVASYFQRTTGRPLSDVFLMRRAEFGKLRRLITSTATSSLT